MAKAKTFPGTCFCPHADYWNNLRSLSWMIWKFFTEAWVTLPWKLSTYDCVSSFHTGVLLWSSITLSVFLFCHLASSDSWSCNEEEWSIFRHGHRRQWKLWPLGNTYISWANGHSLMVHVHSRNDDTHFSRSFESQDIGFLDWKHNK